MGWEEAAAHLDALGVDAMKSLSPSLHRIQAICDALDHPERHLQAIHIAGTNGKTSTARIATSLLVAAGLKVGTFTSPHLTDVAERIGLDGYPVPHDVFGEVFDHLAPFLEVTEAKLAEPLTYFEILTAMFFLWAAEAVDAAVIETGLGGRWDATNVVTSSVAVLTNIALDHTALLGHDTETIAREKSGIVKKDSVAVVGERVPNVLEVILAAAEASNAEVSQITRDFDVLDNRVAFGGRYLSLRTHRRTYEGLFLPVHGRHQGANAAVALEAVTRFLPAHDLSEDLVAEGFARVEIPGRMETFPLTPVPVVLDVAHNPDGMSAFVTGLAEAFGFERLVAVAGFLSDKDWGGMLTELARVASTVIVTAPAFPRAAAVREVAAAAEALGMKVETSDTVAGALARAISIAESGDLLCVTGSHYVVGEARDFLKG